MTDKTIEQEIQDTNRLLQISKLLDSLTERQIAEVLEHVNNDTLGNIADWIEDYDIEDENMNPEIKKFPLDKIDAEILSDEIREELFKQSEAEDEPLELSEEESKLFNDN